MPDNPVCRNVGEASNRLNPNVEIEFESEKKTIYSYYIQGLVFPTAQNPFKQVETKFRKISGF